MTKIVIIAAHDLNGGIGFQNQLPWAIKEDMAFFKNTTMGKTVIMGRKTHESIGRALPGRNNIVITSKASRQFKGCITSTSLEAALAYCQHHDEAEVYVIGGTSIYQQAMKYAHKLLLTEVQHEYVCDSHFPRSDIRERFVETCRQYLSSEETGIPIQFVTYELRSDVFAREEVARIKRLTSTPGPVQDAIQHLAKLSESLHSPNKTQPMNQPIKHPQHILAIDKEFTDELPGMNLPHGLTRFMPGQYEQWLIESQAHLMTGQREKLEFDPRFRQILPYTPVVFSDTPDDIDWANSPLFLYQRTKKVGEGRLGGKFSIGLGGHVDHEDVQSSRSIVSFKDTVNVNLEREIALEELDINTNDSKVFHFETRPFGLLRDDSNNVGKVHLAVVNVIVLPTHYTAECREDELITCVPMTAQMLKDSGLEFEGWTQMLIDAFLGEECSVLPAPRREVYEDVIMGGFYIETVEGDKWTELAIEYNVTVATLYRLNLGNYTTNEIKPGTRVNVPDQPGWMTRIDTPQALLDALTNDVDGSRQKTNALLEAAGVSPAFEQKTIYEPTPESQASMTSIVLKGILRHGPDYENCGLRFLVTQSLADRLVELEPQISDLILKEIVSIVPEDHIPGEGMVMDEESAKLAKQGAITWHFPDSDRPSMPAPHPISSVTRETVELDSEQERTMLHVKLDENESTDQLSDALTQAMRLHKESFPRGMTTPASLAQWLHRAGFSLVQHDKPVHVTAQVESTGEAIELEASRLKAMPNPSEEDLESWLFNAIWDVVKHWDVNVPSHYTGYCGANGSHVKLILDSIEARSAVPVGANTTASRLTAMSPSEIAEKLFSASVPGDGLSKEALADAEAGFHRQVKLGEANETPRHTLQNGDSINGICELYGISVEDFDRWNGFERGHAWPTHTGYVFVADPSLPAAEVHRLAREKSDKS